MRLIIERYLMREIALTFVAVSLLLMLMFFSSTFIHLLTKTLEGDYPANILFTLFALKGVGNIVFILPFAFFIAVLLTFGRLYKDNEIVVLMACGAGPRRLFASVGMLALLVALVIGYLSLFFAPWAEEKSSQLLDEVGAKQDIQGIIPGRFNSLGPGSPTIYVERQEPKSGVLSGIFAQGEGTAADGSPAHYLLKAATAYERRDPQSGARYLVLQDGYRYEGKPGRRDYRIVQFAEHGIRLQEQAVVASSRPRYAVASARLWQTGEGVDMAELHWRLAMPISTLLLALLAVPLSRGSPRGGRYAGLVFGILAFVLYNNLLTVGRTALGKGELPGFIGLWWVHGLLLGLLWLLVWRQQRMPGPRRQKGEGA
ncbi:MAG: LPS export ABC transporter permease LptF [Gammaproteobacteria bacterium]|nr:LPS export ABC transporter permease LptF [Gammaproteobacteria bacterium]